ncbi:hypothetical protein [Pseudoxanthomonas sp.]|uniref:hypothetical protein n=1 Tax=Pseudoxanthomonas sp. TaxID=1871049 RepID=UPI00261635BD|nr:hypothetical protein [Pseudoxanthomonas sp.]WDS35059.1 MAG: hypothetical protein O8I58_11820 [Pseudoxanthomonas sp.]
MPVVVEDHGPSTKKPALRRAFCFKALDDQRYTLLKGASRFRGDDGAAKAGASARDEIVVGLYEETRLAAGFFSGTRSPLSRG